MKRRARARSDRSSNQLSQKQQQLDTLSDTIATYLRTGSVQEAGLRLVRGALTVTQGAYGFVGLVVAGPSRQPMLRILAWDGVDAPSFGNSPFFLSVKQSYERDGYVDFAELSNLFGWVVQNGKALLTNEPAKDPRRSGNRPVEHPPLDSFLGVPIRDGTGVIGMIGVANRPGGFGRAEQSRLSALAQLAGIFCRSYLEKVRHEQLAEQLRQAQKMEALGQLASGIAHDFANILSIVGGYAERIEQRISAGSPLRSDVDRIQRAVDRGTSLTQQLLVFSRRQNRKSLVLDLNGLVADTEKMLRRVIGEDVRIAAHLVPDAARVRADAAELQQIIVNLVLNARDAMPLGGEVRLETSLEVIGELQASRHSGQPGPHARLTVADTGTGMDAATAARAFEPFFTTKPVGRGTGLGLATVYAAVQRAGGHIRLESEPGRGTRVSLWIPTTQEPVSQPDAAAVRPGRAHGEVILLVEDEEEVRELTAAMLRSAGYEVIEAGSAEEALQTWRVTVRPVALIVADVVMPGASGPQFFRDVTRTDPEARVLFISGYTYDILQRYGFEKDSGPVLAKPFSSAQLLAAVRDRLHARR